MDSYARLIEGLPERLASGHVQRGGARATRTAIGALPLANPAEAARGLERLLDGMLVTAWPGAERIEALEHVRDPANALCADVERRISAESHPLAQASLEWVETAQRLQWKLACAHALALHELCAPAGKLPRFKAKAAAGAAVRGLEHTHRTLLWSYRRYAAPPAGAWRLAHALAAFAHELDIADEPVDDALAPARNVHAHALLLAMSNPYRFNARELQQAEQVLACVAGACGLGRVQAGAPGIAVDPDSDAGPGYVAEDRVGAGDGLLAIDPAPARQVFDGYLARLVPGATAIDMRGVGGSVVTTTAAFLERIAAAWEPAQRGHARLDAVHSLDVVIGMRALHFALADGMDFETFLRRVQSEVLAAGGEPPLPPWRAPADAAPSGVACGTVLDQSAGGYRLRLKAASAPRIRIGDVLGLAPLADDIGPRDWMVGLIRWLRHEGDDVLLGVELVARRARAAGVRRCGGQAEAAAQRAVLLDDHAGAQDPALLLAGVLARDVETLAALELAMPAAAADWRSHADFVTLRVTAVQALSGDCFRLALAAPPDAGNGLADAYTGQADAMAP